METQQSLLLKKKVLRPQKRQPKNVFRYTGTLKNSNDVAAKLIATAHTFNECSDQDLQAEMQLQQSKEVWFKDWGGHIDFKPWPAKRTPSKQVKRKLQIKRKMFVMDNSGKRTQWYPVVTSQASGSFELNIYIRSNGMPVEYELDFEMQFGAIVNKKSIWGQQITRKITRNTKKIGQAKTLTPNGPWGLKVSATFLHEYFTAASSDFQWVLCAGNTSLSHCWILCSILRLGRTFVFRIDRNDDCIRIDRKKRRKIDGQPVAEVTVRTVAARLMNSSHDPRTVDILMRQQQQRQQQQAEEIQMLRHLLTERNTHIKYLHHHLNERIRQARLQQLDHNRFLSCMGDVGLLQSHHPRRNAVPGPGKSGMTSNYMTRRFGGRIRVGRRTNTGASAPPSRATNNRPDDNFSMDRLAEAFLFGANNKTTHNRSGGKPALVNITHPVPCAPPASKPSAPTNSRAIVHFSARRASGPDRSATSGIARPGGAGFSAASHTLVTNHNPRSGLSRSLNQRLGSNSLARGATGLFEQWTDTLMNGRTKSTVAKTPPGATGGPTHSKNLPGRVPLIGNLVDPDESSIKKSGGLYRMSGRVGVNRSAAIGSTGIPLVGRRIEQPGWHSTFVKTETLPIVSGRH